ncbi:MAG TPA: hypothetical protein VGH27_27160 [Streptosporangiaceae bacterium]
MPRTASHQVQAPASHDPNPANGGQAAQTSAVGAILISRPAAWSRTRPGCTGTGPVLVTWGGAGQGDLGRVSWDDLDRDQPR